MRAGFLVPVTFAALLGLAACGEPAEAPAPAEAAAPAAPAPTLAELPAPWNGANLETGAAEFNKCRSCHTLKAGANLVGPSLHGVFERGPGAVPKFRYSEAMKKAEFTQWTPELVDHWLQKPTDFMPGTAMFFNGISKEEARRDLIGYLLIESRK
jgi:cytochrome c